MEYVGVFISHICEIHLLELNFLHLSKALKLGCCLNHLHSHLCHVDLPLADHHFWNVKENSIHPSMPPSIYLSIHPSIHSAHPSFHILWALIAKIQWSLIKF